MDQKFDLMNHRTQLAAVIGGTADFVNDYGYDQLHRMTGIQQHGVAGGHAVSEKWIDLAYDLAGQFDSITRYADLSATQLVAQSDFTFDLTGRLTDLVHSTLNSQPSTLASYNWTFDVANRITQFESLTDGTVNYNYDNRDQATAADYDYQTDEDYQYDENGNRLSYSSTLTGGGQEGVVTGDLNRLLDDGTYTYVYDAEGNRTARFVDVDDDGDLSAGDTSVTLYGWDHRNRLVTVTTYDDDPEENPQASKLKEVTHIYDTYNRWIGRKVDADGDGAVDTETFFVYDGNQIVLQFDGTEVTALSHRYLWGPMVDQILADEAMTDLAQEGDVLWPLTDNLGTVRDLAEYDEATDTTTIVDHYVYDAFGNETDHTGSNEFLFKYTGRAFDEETGLQNNLNRWFDPTVGRWLSEDPIGFEAGDANVYRYVGNASTLATDPSGLATYAMAPPQAAAAGWTAKDIATTFGLTMAAAQKLVDAAALTAATAAMVTTFQANAKGPDPCALAESALNQAEKALKSYEKLITSHKGKIANPKQNMKRMIPGKTEAQNIAIAIADWNKDIAKAEFNVKAAKAAIETLRQAKNAACRRWYKPWTW